MRDIKYLFSEGTGMDKIIPFSSWFYAFKKSHRLAKINTLEEINKLPKENITIIRGIKDYYFCDKESAETIKKEGLRLIEVDAGHNWNQNIADAVNKIIGEN